jgi:hypothetical protein
MLKKTMNSESKNDGQVSQPFNIQIEKIRELRSKILDRIAKDEVFRQGLVDNPAKAMLESGLFDEIHAHRKALLVQLATQGLDPVLWMMCTQTCLTGSNCSDTGGF